MVLLLQEELIEAREEIQTLRTMPPLEKVDSQLEARNAELLNEINSMMQMNHQLQRDLEEAQKTKGQNDTIPQETERLNTLIVELQRQVASSITQELLKEIAQGN